jgi:hypothetical protein
MNQGLCRVKPPGFFGNHDGGFLIPILFRQRVEGKPPDPPADNFFIGFNRQGRKTPALKGVVHGNGYIFQGIYQCTVQVENYATVFHGFIMMDLVGTYYQPLQKSKRFSCLCMTLLRLEQKI